MEPPNPMAILASLEVIQNQLPHLEATIARLVKLHKELPAGDARNLLLEEISCLDVISEVMKMAVDSFGSAS
jgi:hypothetical protein